MIRELFAVGLGGAAGSIVRYMLSVWLLGGHTLLGFPAGTFTVNAAGSLLIGILLETTNSAAAGWLLIAGFCGGFTTFSTFSSDVVRMLKSGDYTAAGLCIALNFAACVCCILLGAALGRLLKR
jgi:CrcB protein